MARRSGIHGHEKPNEGETNDWITPPAIVRRLGHFDLDPCACITSPWKLAENNFYLPDKNGLMEPWHGRVWCNPPYGPNIFDWANRMALHRNGIMLIFSRTETDAWKRIWKDADAILFPYGRCAFLLPDGKQAAQGTAPSSLIAYGEANVIALHDANISGAIVPKAKWRDGVKISTL